MTTYLDTFKAVGALGVMLSLLGVFFFLASSGSSVTSLIPSFFGLAFIALAYFAVRKLNERVALISITLLAVLAAFGSVAGLFDLFRIAAGADVARPMGALAQSLMFLSSVVVIWMSTRAYRKHLDESYY